jgi:antitoxin HicB
MGNTHRFDQKSYRARFDLLLPAASGCASWIHKEDTDNTRSGFAAGTQASEGVRTMNKKHLGSSIDDFLREENIFEESQAQAIKEVVAWQLTTAMKKKNISKTRMAALLRTSRAQVDRILDPKRDITLSSLQRAAALVGHKVLIELV